MQKVASNDCFKTEPIVDGHSRGEVYDSPADNSFCRGALAEE